MIYLLAHLAAPTAAAPNAIVPNYGPRFDGGDDSVVAIDLALPIPAVAWQVTVGDKPYAVGLHPTEHFAYFVIQGPEVAGDQEVVVFNLNTQQLFGRIPVGKVPYAIAFKPDGNRAYVINRRSDTISVLDTDGTSSGFQTLATTIDLKAEMAAFGATCDGTGTQVGSPTDLCGPKGAVSNGDYLYVTNYYDDSVAVIDVRPGPTLNQVIDVVDMSFTGCAEPSDCAGPRAIALSEDGDTLYVVRRQSDEVAFLDLSTTPEAPDFDPATDLVGTGTKPRGIAVLSTDKLAVVNYESDDMTVIDVDPSNPNAPEVEQTVTAIGDGPFAIAITPDEDELIVTSFSNHGLVRIDISDSDPNNWIVNEWIIQALDGPAGMGPAWITPMGP